MKKYKTSLVLGKMCPPHKGHFYLIDTAIENSEKVHVMVCHNESQPIPGKIRYESVKEYYRDNKNVIVHNCDDTGLPQHEHECLDLDEFYSYWIPFVYETLREDLDCVFTSESYGKEFSEYLEVDHFLVDIDRNKFPISGTKVRNNPIENWDFINDDIKNYYMKKIAILGSESTGKSTMVKILSNRYKSTMVEEYGREYVESLTDLGQIENLFDLTKTDLEYIALDHQKSISNKKKNPCKFLFIDTEAIVTKVFGKLIIGEDFHSDIIENIIDTQQFDMYFVLDRDIPFVDDGTRSGESNRKFSQDNIIKELELKGYDYHLIKGNDYDERFFKICKLIDKKFKID